MPEPVAVAAPTPQTATSQSSQPSPSAPSPSSLDPNYSSFSGTEVKTDQATTATTENKSEAWFTSWIKQDGTLDHTAFDKAPDEVRKMRPDLERYKTPDEFVKAWGGLKTLATKKGIIDPLPKDATPEMKAEHQAIIRRVNGVPENPEGYNLTKPQDLPDNLWDQNYANMMAKVAHEEGLSPTAMQKLAQAEIAHTKTIIEQNQKMEQEWFQKQDALFREVAQREGLDYGKAKDLAERAGARYGADPQNPLYKNATFLAIMTRVGKALGEDSMVKGESAKNMSLSPDQMTPEQANAAARDVSTNKEHADYKAYWDKNHKNHDEVVNRVNKLWVKAASNRPQRGGSR
jgi:hypothetical protein